MVKLTKIQRKNQDRIEAWLAGKEFKENSRAKPAVPDLAVEQVLDEYVPDDIEAAGAYHTPREMAIEVRNKLDSAIDYTNIIDPCAGIGNLVYPWYQEMPITAVEFQMESAKVGEALFAEMHWHMADAFEWYRETEPKYDLVLMNPPFGCDRGFWTARTQIDFCKRSEHLFMVLATRLAKIGGHIAVVAPYNFVSNFPVSLATWTNKRLAFQWKTPNPLPGKFYLTGIRVHLFLFKRVECREDVPFDPASVVAWGPSPVRIVDLDALEEFSRVGQKDWPPSSKEAIRMLRFRHLYKLEGYLKRAPHDYGFLYWNGAVYGG